jgi:ribosome biogenesis GTPase
VRFQPVESGGDAPPPAEQSPGLSEGVIQEVAERQTTLTRQYGRRQQVVAANVDLALIVMAADQPTLRPHLIDRYLVAVHKGGMRPAVCINKLDLDTNGQAASVADRYRDLGYHALLTCALDGRGLDGLRRLLTDQMSVLVGPSGAGKSSLLNALDPQLSLRVGSLSDLRRGRHTTSTAHLRRWAFGGFVVDTPGMRQLELAEVEAEELEAYFVEFVDLIRQCHFPDCSHTHEAACAIKAAVEAGNISPERYESYCKMHQECGARPKY